MHNTRTPVNRTHVVNQDNPSETFTVTVIQLETALISFSLTHSIPMGAHKQITYMSFLPTTCPTYLPFFQLKLIKWSTHMTNSSAFLFRELVMQFHNKSSL